MKNIAICILFSFTCVGLNAQEVVNEEAARKAKEINQLKLSEESMYAEIIELASDDFEAVSLAQQKSINKLQNNVIEACARQMNITKEQAKEIFDTIDDKCQNVVIKKGDMVRVFAYIAKDAVGLSRKKANKKDIEEIFGSEEMVDSAMIEKNTAMAINLLMGNKDSIDNVTYKQPPVTTTTTTTTTTTVVTKTEITQPTVTQTVVTPVTEPVVEAKEEPKKEPVAEPVLNVTVPTLCQKLIEKGNLKELKRYLIQEKNYHKLMYGNSNTMQNKEKCYVVIVDKTTQNIVSVLDKGKNERINFMTKKMDSYSNYKIGNYAAIFVQEY